MRRARWITFVKSHRKIQRLLYVRNRTGKNTNGSKLAFKTLITPSQEAVNRHIQAVKGQVRARRSLSQGELIRAINSLTKGWSNYYKTLVAAAVFHKCDHILFLQLVQWAKHKHPTRGMRWILRTYWHQEETRRWVFREGVDTNQPQKNC